MEEDIQKIWEAIKALQKNTLPSDHRHTGYDSNKVLWHDLGQRKIHIHHTIPGAQAATATNYGTFFIVPVKSVLTKFEEIHQTAGSDGSDVLLNLEKLSGTTAPNSGDEMLSEDLSLKATANTLQEGSITTDTADRTLEAGDRLCLKDTGTLTAVANVSVLVELTVI